jgi:hypothetical protein
MFDRAVQTELATVLEKLLKDYPQLEGITVTFSWGYGLDRSALASGITRFADEKITLQHATRMLSALSNSQCDLMTAVLTGAEKA